MASANSITMQRGIREREEIRSSLRSAGLLKIDDDVLSKCMCANQYFLIRYPCVE